jgi:hypothetical protein
MLIGIGTLESSFTTSSAPPSNEQRSGKQTHQSISRKPKLIGIVTESQSFTFGFTNR